MPCKRLFSVGLLTVLVIAGVVLPALAQDDTRLQMDISTTDLQTGQEYEVTIQIENVAEFWLANTEIKYDPELVYVIGTQSGSPVTQGLFFTTGSSMVIRNAVQDDLLLYAASQLAPADVLSGSGALGTFRIYPIAPGTTTLAFQRAEIYTTTFVEQNGERVGTDARPVDFTPVLLELTITGDPVLPPSEATATPTPTNTPPGQVTSQPQPTQQPTLESATRVPDTPDTGDTGTQTAADEDEGGSDTTLLIVALVAVAVLIALGVGVFMGRRARR
jgi:hypothetical protein